MKLLSVNVSLPKRVPYKGKTTTTGIFKEPVDGRVMLRTLNLDGDGQADLKGHGGAYKAAYVYSIENYDYWREELGRNDFSYGQFGENLTVEGMPDETLHMGDVFRIGSAVVEVTQPRVLPRGLHLPGRAARAGRPGPRACRHVVSGALTSRRTGGKRRSRRSRIRGGDRPGSRCRSGGR